MLSVESEDSPPENSLMSETPPESAPAPIVKHNETSSDVSINDIKSMLSNMPTKLEIVQMLNDLQSSFDHSSWREIVVVLERLELQVKQQSLPPTYGMEDFLGSSQPLRALQKKHTIELESLKNELRKKHSENKRLHSILQAAQAPDEPSDEDVERKFGKLRNCALQFSREHISDFLTLKPLSDMSIRNKQLCIDALIVRYLYDAFTNTTKTFGLDRPLEQHQRDFERQLHQFEAPRLEIASWRAETVKMATYLRSSHRSDTIMSTSNNILEKLGRFVNFIDDNAALQALYELCGTTYDLALYLRKSKIEFNWQQKVDQELDVANFQIHHGYHENDGNDCFVPCKILFGPVIKVNDQGTRCVRKGEILVPHSE